MRGLIKICGITNLDDARAAVAAGADALGFVFADSPRCVRPEQVRAIAAALPPATRKIGVFVETPEPEIAAIAAACGLDTVQLLGERAPTASAPLQGLALWRGLRLPRGAGAAAAWVERAAAFLLEPDVAGRHGGTGVTLDWDRVRGLRLGRPLVLAGGLTPANVAEAIRRSGADGVDVCGGVESFPGRKQADRMHAFVSAARQAFGETAE